MTERVPPDPRAITSRTELGRALTALRIDADLSIRQLARRADIPWTTVGGYCAGRNVPTPAQMPRVRAMLGACGVPDGDLDDWDDAIRRARASAATPDTRAGSPYPGLSSFDVADERVFFGRAAETADILAWLERLRDDPGPGRGTLAVVGPSGSGKSSLLRAGVVAALRRDPQRWDVVLVTPGSDPLAVLPDPGSPADGIRQVVVVDQFEEVFTSVDAAVRARFLGRLAAGAPGRIVVLGMRADFYATAAREPVLLPVLQHAQFLVGPLDAAALRETIVGPAGAAGVEVEDGLVDLVLADLAPHDGRDDAHDAGALPLLSHALLSAWERGTGRTLTREDYRGAGGIGAAVQRTAEDAYTALGPDEQAAARALFLRLVHVEDDVAVTRRRITGSELEDLQDDDTVAGLVSGFVQRRLLTATDGSLEISHEALLSAWPRLRGWLEEDRVGLQLHRQVTEAANSWVRAGRDESLLLRGTLLAGAADLAAHPSHRTVLSRQEQEYVAAGVAAREAAERAARRRTRRLQQQLVALGVLLLVAAGLAALSLHAESSADAAERRAGAARDEALSRQIAGRARELAASNPALAQQLALVAYREAPSDDARGTLVDQSSRPSITRVLGEQGPTPLAITRDGRTVAVGRAASGTVALYDRTRAVPRLVATVRPPDPRPKQAFALAFSPDGRLLAIAGESRTVRLVDVSDRARPRVRGQIPTGFTGDVQDVAFSPDGRLLAVAGTGARSVALWSVSDPAAPSALPALPGAPAGPAVTVLRVRFSPDGRTLAADGRDDSTLYTWQLRGDTVTGSRHRPVGTGGLYGLAWLPDGRRLLLGDRDGQVLVVDARTLRADGAPLDVGTGQVTVLAAAPDGDRFVAGASDNTVTQWSLRSRLELSGVGDPGPVTGVAYGPGGTTVLSTAADGTLLSYAAGSGLPADGDVFNLQASRDGTRLAVATGTPRPGVRILDLSDPDSPRRASPLITSPPGVSDVSGTAGLRPDGEVVAAGTQTGMLLLYDVSDPARPRPLARLQALTAGSLLEAITFSPDGRWLVAAGDDDTARVIDVSDPSRPRPLATLRTGGLALGTAVSRDGRYLAVASGDGRAWVWEMRDPARPRRVATLGGFASYVYAVAFSPDSSRLAVGSADHTVLLWQLHGSARPTRVGPRLIGPSDYVLSVAFSPDGDRLAVGSSDHTVRVYDMRGVPRRVPELALTSMPGNVFAVMWSPDGSRVMGGGRPEAIRSWDLNLAAYRTRLCAVAGTPITRDEWALYVPGARYDPPCR
ncbi:nSTAND1 domain-containing NTPase [Jatrophihabitans fulvus]